MVVKVKKMDAVRLVLSGVILIGGLAWVSVASADGGDVGEFKEHKAVVTSYNPTEPEIQLGDVSILDIDESGEVGLDTEGAQGQIDATGDVAIDGVKGKGKIYYILEKGGDIISVHVDKNLIEGEDGSVVKIVDVDAIHGNNGTADKDGFKSNIVPDDVLPKTGLTPDNAKTYASVLLGIMGVVGIGVGEGLRRRKQV